VKTRGAGAVGKKATAPSSTEASVESLEQGDGEHPAASAAEEYIADPPLNQKKGTSRSQPTVAGKRQPQSQQSAKTVKATQQKATPAPSIDTDAVMEGEAPGVNAPKFSQSPVIREDDERNVASAEVNESVRASLQLLKKKPRVRGGILGRGSSSISESVDTTHPSPPPLPPVAVPPVAVAVSAAQRNSTSPLPLSESPNSPPAAQRAQKKKSVPIATRRPNPSASGCTRTSDCSCPLCVIPVEELPIIASSPQRAPSHRDEVADVVMIGSSKLTALMKTRQEMNKQKASTTGKKKETKSAMYVAIFPPSLSVPFVSLLLCLLPPIFTLSLSPVLSNAVLFLQMEKTIESTTPSHRQCSCWSQRIFLFPLSVRSQLPR
jgi:hypothetical protein